MEVFTQINFVADFIRLKLKFTFLNQNNRLLSHPLGDLGNVHTSPIARWKARGRLSIRFFAIPHG